MKVYVLLEEWSMDYESGNTIEVYDTKEKALKELGDEIKWARVDMNFDEKDDNGLVEEREENSYCIYEDGDYTRNHISISIEEKEIK